MTRNKATKVAEKFNALYFLDGKDATTSSVRPAVIKEVTEGDFNVIISTEGRIFSYRVMKIAMKVCSMYHLMSFVLYGSEGLKIYIHS